MIYELFLVAVLIGAGYWGWYYVRHRPHGTATFGVMQLAAAALAGLGFLGHRLDIAWLGIPGAIGLGAGGCLLVIGPVARVLARRMVVSERMALAIRLLDLAELLAPGSGVAEEKALVRAMSEIREGRIEQTVEALAAARERVGDEARLAIDERIAMLYLAAHRWSDAIAHAEAHLLGARPPPGSHEGVDGSLRTALGFAPPVWVDLLGAYGRTGDLDQAARMLARLEDACAGRDDAAVWIHRARMMFLALAGRIEAVRALVAPDRSRHMTPAARTYWIAVAHEHGGDRAAAAAAYEKARARSRGRPRDLIDQALAGLGNSRRAELAPQASEVVARVEAAPLPPPIRLARPRRPRATWLLTTGVLAASAITTLWIGDTDDLGVLVRAGAMVRSMVAAGEWWRMISCLFVHVGLWHLVLNAFGLVILGRLAEDLFGSARTIAIFAVSGIAGALASYAVSPAGISAGASGAVFGLLGAIFVEITWHRQRYRAAWKRGLWGGLAVIAVSQLGFDLFYPMVDRWAHGGGLAAGAVIGVALSPAARWTRAGGVVGRALAIGFGAACAAAAILVVGTSLAGSLARGGVERRRLGPIEIRVPASWQVEPAQPVPAGVPWQIDGELVQADGIVTIRLGHQDATEPVKPPVQPPVQIDPPRPETNHSEKDEPEDHIKFIPATESVIALPAGWSGTEFWGLEPRDEMGYRQRIRVVACSRVFGAQTIFVAIQVPESIAIAAPEFFAQLLASIGPAS